MAKIHSIDPFPSDIDRDYFGAWLSGFTDGEGCFGLMRASSKPTDPKTVFSIKLRRDDGAVLYLLQSFWQCGRIYLTENKSLVAGVNPSVTFSVGRLHDHLRVVIPHFEKYPLLAKKRRDFTIWKQGVLLKHEVSCRPIRSRGYNAGHLPRWTKEELEYFSSLIVSLKEQRKYDADVISPKELPKSDEPYLFQ